MSRPLMDAEAPPRKPFQKKYNERLELPISVVGSIGVHTLLLCLVVFGLFQLMDRKRKDAVPITMITGPDETGAGSPGSGQAPDQLAPGMTANTTADIARITSEPLPIVKAKIEEIIDVPTGEITIPDATAAGIASLDEALQKALFKPRPGNGDGKGTGTSGQPGTGPGGIGADGTLARSMRWVMRFEVRDGKDYLRQLAVLKATVLVPVPPENKRMLIFTNLTADTPNRIATESEINELSRQVRFCDISAKAVGDIANALKLDFQPVCFFAFFSKDLEAKLAKDEEDFKGLKANDIEETIFKVTVTGNSATFTIVDQKLKKH